MKVYIFSGEYANGDQYAERLTSLWSVGEQLRHITSETNQMQPPSYRIVAESIAIETEEE